jgi:hypothetical protein
MAAAGIVSDPHKQNLNGPGYRACSRGTQVAATGRVENDRATPSRDSSPTEPRPIQDEWGIYDPERAGFEAILRRLGVNDDDRRSSSSDEDAR